MTQVWAFLIAAIWPLAKKVLIMLGIGFVTYEGLSLLANNAIQAAQANWSQLSITSLQMLSLMGAPDALGIICGALVARVSFIAFGKLGKVTA